MENATPKPEPLHSWRAHTQPITSLQFVSHDSFSTVVSSATDGSVRLWSPSGEYLGTFGSGMYASMANAVEQYQALLGGIDGKGEAGGGGHAGTWMSAGSKISSLRLLSGAPLQRLPTNPAAGEKSNRRYGNFDIIFGSFFARFSAPPRPASAV